MPHAKNFPFESLGFIDIEHHEGDVIKSRERIALGAIDEEHSPLEEYIRRVEETSDLMSCVNPPLMHQKGVK